MENNSISRETKLEEKEYKWGFTSDVETEVFPKEKGTIYLVVR